MSDSLVLLLVLGPGLALAVAIGFITRNDPIAAKATEQVERQPLIRIKDVLASAFGPVVILLLMNNMFGAILLLLSGAFLMLQDKYFPDVYFIKGMLAKVFGAIHLGLGMLMIALHVS